MLMSQIASSNPTPRSTSRVMMTGLIGPDLQREDYWSGSSHDDCARLVLWNPAEKLGISHGRSSKDGTTFIACRPRFCTPPSRPHQNQRRARNARTAAWMVIDAAVAIGAGVTARSVTLTPWYDSG